MRKRGAFGNIILYTTQAHNYSSVSWRSTETFLPVLYVYTVPPFARQLIRVHRPRHTGRGYVGSAARVTVSVSTLSTCSESSNNDADPQGCHSDSVGGDVGVSGLVLRGHRVRGPDGGLRRQAVRGHSQSETVAAHRTRPPVKR